MLAHDRPLYACKEWHIFGMSINRNRGEVLIHAIAYICAQRMNILWVTPTSSVTWDYKFHKTAVCALYYYHPLKFIYFLKLYIPLCYNGIDTPKILQRSSTFAVSKNNVPSKASVSFLLFDLELYLLWTEVILIAFSFYQLP